MSAKSSKQSAVYIFSQGHCMCYMALGSPKCCIWTEGLALTLDQFNIVAMREKRPSIHQLRERAWGGGGGAGALTFEQGG